VEGVPAPRIQSRVYVPTARRQREAQGEIRREPGPPREGRGRPRPGGANEGAVAKRATEAEKLRRRAEASTLAQDKGIPLAHAHRVIQGTATLNEVLKSLVRQEKFDRLVNQDGLDPSLAGQVASGHLTKERGLILNKIRVFRRTRLDLDAVKLAEMESLHVALNLFGRGWVPGRVQAARVYDFDFLADGAEKPEELFKHDVKAVGRAANLTAIRAAARFIPTIQSEGLAATANRGERIRPPDDLLLRLLEESRDHDFVTRDGEIIRGRVASFGRWDVDVNLPDGGPTVTLMFHALHEQSLVIPGSGEPDAGG
jgi:hypothetical protein